MQNIEQLREELVINFEKMKTKERDLKLGKELANTAGKILSSLKVEMDYNRITGKDKKISFLEVNEKASN